jgi:hypothetical protein
VSRQVITSLKRLVRKYGGQLRMEWDVVLTIISDVGSSPLVTAPVAPRPADRDDSHFSTASHGSSDVYQPHSGAALSLNADVSLSGGSAAASPFDLSSRRLSVSLASAEGTPTTVTAAPVDSGVPRGDRADAQSQSLSLSLSQSQALSRNQSQSQLGLFSSETPPLPQLVADLSADPLGSQGRVAIERWASNAVAAPVATAAAVPPSVRAQLVREIVVLLVCIKDVLEADKV